MDLTNKAALITGGKRIGLAIAGAIAKRGVDVAFTYRTSQAEAEEGVALVRAAGRRSIAIKADLARTEDGEAAVRQTVEAFGRIDILINMASLYGRHAFDELKVSDWDASLAVDLRAAFVCSRAAVPHMRKAGGGRIISFSDWVARSGRPRYQGYLPYYVAKAGVIALTEALALEVAEHNILVNAIAPGPIVAPPDTSDEESGAIEMATPLGRWGGEEEIAKVVVGLLDSDFITGETIRVDGGRHVR